MREVGETKILLEKHRAQTLGRRILNRLAGDYPSRAERRDLREYEFENRLPIEKIAGNVFNADVDTRRHNSTIGLYGLFNPPDLRHHVARPRLKGRYTTEAYDIAEDLRQPDFIYRLCVATNRPELAADATLNRAGFYRPGSKKQQAAEGAFGVYLADWDMSKVELIPFSEAFFEQLEPGLQQGLVQASQKLANLAKERVLANPLSSL